ncbi:YraN family protein [uncultured Cardiobacterium sp.]|uniref:YraN family protein n=1 Tax=uncultured Cardiobacterium sp. TaxID=417619 RepID=UPI0026157B00|nr:YraN family protein [uncultured Cardiobacterium sp.]
MFLAKLAPHLRRGRAGEKRAAAYLKAQGLVIVANNFRSRYGEIDLIARDGAVLVFVEVRSRAAGAQVSAAASIGAAKREKIRKTAQVYLQQHHPTTPPDCRFDAVCIDGAEITWLRAAFCA